MSALWLALFAALSINVLRCTPCPTKCEGKLACDEATGQCKDFCSGIVCSGGFDCDPATGLCELYPDSINHCTTVVCSGSTSCDPLTGDCVDACALVISCPENGEVCDPLYGGCLPVCSTSSSPCYCQGASRTCVGPNSSANITGEVCGTSTCLKLCAAGSPGPCQCGNVADPSRFCSSDQYCTSIDPSGSCASGCAARVETNCTGNCVWNNSRCISPVACGDFPNQGVCQGHPQSLGLNCWWYSGGGFCHVYGAEIVTATHSNDSIEAIIRDTAGQNNTDIKIDSTAQHLLKEDSIPFSKPEFSLEGSVLGGAGQTAYTPIDVSSTGGFVFTTTTTTVVQAVVISTVSLVRESSTPSSSAIISAESSTVVSSSKSITVYQSTISIQSTTSITSPVVQILNYFLSMMSVTISGARPRSFAMSNQVTTCLILGDNATISLTNSDATFQDVVLDHSSTGALKALGGKVSLTKVTFTENLIGGGYGKLRHNAYFQNAQVTIGAQVTSDGGNNLFFSTSPPDFTTFNELTTDNVLSFEPTVSSAAGDNGVITFNGDFVPCDFKVNVYSEGGVVPINGLVNIPLNVHNDKSASIGGVGSLGDGKYDFEFINEVGRSFSKTTAKGISVSFKKPDDNKIPTGAIVAIILVSVLVVAAIIVIIIIGVYFHNKKRAALAESEELDDSSSSSNAEEDKEKDTQV